MTTPMPTASHLDVQQPDVVPMRDAHDDEIPTSARRLAEVGRSNGWAVRVTYACGHRRHMDGSPVESLAVRMRGREKGVVACWTDGEASGAWRVGPERESRFNRVLTFRISVNDAKALAKEPQVLS